MLIVDDTILYRKMASDVASHFKEVEVVGTAPNGDLALKKLELNQVDLVLCDVHMPGKNGVETLIEIKKRFPQTQVVMMSGISTPSADITIQALEKGAIDFIQKPNSGSVQENINRLKSDLKVVLRLVQIRLTTSKILDNKQVQKPDSKPIPKKAIISTPVPKKFSIIAIGVSTGGPEALNQLIPALPKDLPVPIVIVQHMPPKFTQSLAESLDRKSKLRVVEGRESEKIKPGTVYIAPGGQHMVLREKDKSLLIGLNNGPPENSCRPAIDVLFRSVASAYGKKGILAIVLTGMGNDGASGMRTLKRKGCFCITQSESSCVVYGMPKAVVEAGLSDKSLPLDEISLEICRKLRC